MPHTIDMRDLARRRRRFPAIAFLVILIVIFIGSRTWLSYYIDSLWFGSLGYSGVFWKTLRLESTVFITFFAATFLILYGSLQAMRYAMRSYLPAGNTVYIGRQAVTLPVDSAMRVIIIAISLLVALISGLAMLAEWPMFALYWYAPPASKVVDPIFSKPVNFYLFRLPVWQFVSGWLIVLAVVIGAAAALSIAIATGARAIASRRGRYIPFPRGLPIAFVFLLLMIAFRVYLGRYDYLFADHTILSGVTYTDAHVMIPGLLVISLALVAGAAIIAGTAFTSGRVRWLVLALVPAALCFFVVQGIGWYVGNFVVKPNQLVRERPYIAHNIELTRSAFALDRVARHEFPAETTVDAVEPANNQATLQNIRLWDWRALQDTLRQIQEIRTYYDFPDIDIDRYDIGGNLRQVMLATRELNVDKLPESSRNWINEKLIYTHGYGVTMNPVNGFTPEGLPTLILSNMPVQSTVPGISVTRPEVYFGELTNTDVYVNTRQQEFNYPQGQSNSFTEYQGKGGIVMGGVLRRLLISFERGDLGKVPFSDDITRQSRLLMRRNLRERVSALAPFLLFDKDPYMVVGEDGRLSWMMDGFTVSDAYPYSRHYQLGPDLINYMRNSVKVVIDAYDGTTTFYVFDSEDPIIAAYRRVFPTLFKDASAMPATLRKHVRYPEMLLKLQADVYGLYHMTDPEVFYNREDLWAVASEVGTSPSGEQGAQEMQPNFVLMKLPGEDGVEFVEILPFTPASRNNLIAWIAGRSDGAHYGTLVAYDFPKNRLVDGPMQVEARIDQNAQLSGQLTLWNQQGSQVRRGTLLVIPSGRALLYAEPIYLQAQRSPMPELRLVVLALQDRLAYGPNFESAMAALFAEGAPSLNAPAVAASPPRQPAPPNPTQPDINAIISQAAGALADYQRLTAQGKLAEAGQKLEQLKRTLDELESRKK